MVRVAVIVLYPNQMIKIRLRRSYVLKKRGCFTNAMVKGFITSGKPFRKAEVLVYVSQELELLHDDHLERGN